MTGFWLNLYLLGLRLQKPLLICFNRFDISCFYYFYMLEARERRFKTVHLGNYYDSYASARNKHEEQAYFLRLNQNNEEELPRLLIKATSKDGAVDKSNTRASQRLKVMPARRKVNVQCPLESLKTQAQLEVRKLTPTQKLTQIQHILRTTRELCKKYGFFSLTLAMLKFTMEKNQELKIQVWIHPDVRSSKPLHPIKKQTQFECQMACVSELKELLSLLFPEVELGNGKTFGTVIGYLDGLKADMDLYLRKNVPLNKQPEQGLLEPVRQLKHNYLVMSAKNIQTVCSFSPTKDPEGEKCRKYSNNNISQKPKEPMSLVSSMNSALKQKISPRIKKLIETEDYEVPSPTSPNSKEKQTESDQFYSKMETEAEIPPQFEDLLMSQQKYCSKMKMSTTARRYMTMSTQIESEINILFDSEMKKSNNFYQGAQQVKQSKFFQLARVAEQFDDLF